MTENCFISILLVEDDAEDAFLICKTIEAAPWHPIKVTCLHVSTAREALLALPEHAFDIILTDLFLPDAKDLSVVLDLQLAAPTIPIIVLTGHDDDSMAKMALKLGAQDYLVKGRFDGKMLVRVAQYAIERTQFEIERLRLASFPELNPNPIIEFDPDKRLVTYANPAAKNSFTGLAEGHPHDLLQALAFVAKRAMKEAAQTPLTGQISYSQKTYNVDYHALKVPRVVRVYFLHKNNLEDEGIIT